MVFISVWLTLVVNKYSAVSQCAHAWQIANLAEINFVKIFGRAKQILSVQCVRALSFDKIWLIWKSPGALVSVNLWPKFSQNKYKFGQCVRALSYISLTFSDWLLTPGNKFSVTPIEEMNKEELNACLESFYTSARKQDGQFFKSSSLKAIRAAIQWQVSSHASKLQTVSYRCRPCFHWRKQNIRRIREGTKKVRQN